MSTKQSVFDAQFKALTDDETVGTFEAIVSAFGNVDAVGDRVVPGAFDRTIAEWREKGDPLPIIWSHQWGDPRAHIGFANPEDITEVEKGLKIKGQIDLDNPFASQVYRLMKQRRVKEMSFGYQVRDSKRSKDGVNDLLDLDLLEAGPTLKGANDSTELLGVKSDLEAAAAKCEPPTLKDLLVRVGIDEEEAEKALADAEEKAGRRISRETESELSAVADEAEALVGRIRGLLSQEDSEEEKHVDPQEPQATGNDDSLLEIEAALAAAYRS